MIEGALSEEGYEQKRGCEGVETKPTFESRVPIRVQELQTDAISRGYDGTER